MAGIEGLTWRRVVAQGRGAGSWRRVVAQGGDGDLTRRGRAGARLCR
jgi:hypothetical protein